MTTRIHIDIAPKSQTFSLNRRFDRTARLVGESNMELLQKAHIAIIGLGGVGSFVMEALVRTGIGEITLVDHDLVCTTNTNRQLQAVNGAPGQAKVTLLYERALSINPKVKVHAKQMFYEADNSEEILQPKFTCIIDAIDNMAAKVHLIHTCMQKQLPLIVCLGAAGKIDPTAVRVTDLGLTQVDPVGRWMRKALRRKYGHSNTTHFGIPAVYSPEQPRASIPLTYDQGDPQCVCPHGEDEKNACVSRNVVEGSVMMVTAAFGMAAAAEAVKIITGLKPVYLQ